MGSDDLNAASRRALAKTLVVALGLAGVAQAQTPSTISTISGNGGTAWAGDGGLATNASHATPSGIARDAAGNLFVVEAESNRVRRIAADGTISTIAGNGQATFTGVGSEIAVGDGGPATAAAMSPRQVAVDAAGNVYLTDTQHLRIRKVTPAGIVSTVAGTGLSGFSGDGGPAVSAKLQTLAGIAADAAGNLYVSTGNRIRKVSASGTISTIAGTGGAGHGGDGGLAINAILRSPGGIAVDGQGNVFFADTDNDRVRRIGPSGQITTVIGGGSMRDDFYATNLDLARPTDVALDSKGYLYVVLEDADAVRKVSPTGLIGNAGGYFCPYFLGCPWNSFSGDGGDALKATLNRPRAIELDAADNLYVADTGNMRVRRITPTPPSPDPAGPPAFAPRQNIPIDSYPEGVAIGDFTGDGRNDVVLVTRQFSVFNPRPDDNKVLLYVQQADGSLLAPVKSGFGTSSAEHVGLVLTDLNHDGRKDIVIGHGQGLAVFTGNPAGTLALSTFPVASYWASNPIVAIDINGDGHMDIVTAERDPQLSLDGLRKHFGDGVGGFGPPVYEPHAGGSRSQLVTGDLNNDGKPDLLVRGPGNTPPELFLHDGQSAFRRPRAVRAPHGFSVGMAVGDLNDDGRTDAGYARPGNSPTWLHLFLQDDNGQLDGAITLGTYDAPSHLAMADMNGDGRTDLLVLHDWPALSYYQGLAHGLAPAAKHALRSHNGYRGSTAAIAIGDLDSDGCRDVAIADELEGLVILRGRNCVVTPAVADFNGDRQSDLLWFGPDAGGRIWPAAQSGESTRVAAAGGWSVAAIGDFTGDGASDLFWRNCVNGASRIWPSAQEARSRPASSFSDKAWAIAASGDFTGDGVADLLWRHASGATMLWPSADARRQRRLATLAAGWSAVSSGDYDGDGRTDVFWRHAPTGANLIWRAGGLGGAQRATAILDLAWRVAGSGDVDGDGKADLLWRHARDGGNALWRAAQFNRRTPLQAMADPAWTVAAVGDFDGDRRADIAWHHAGTGTNLVWKRGDPTNAIAVASTPGNWRTTLAQNSCAAPPRSPRRAAPAKLQQPARQASVRRPQP